MTEQHTNLEGLEEILDRHAHEMIVKRRRLGENSSLFSFDIADDFGRTLLADPAILAHIPAVKALQEEVERLRTEMEEQQITRLANYAVNLAKYGDRITTLEATNAAQAEQLVKLEIEAKYNFDLYQDLGQEMAKEPQAGVELTDEESTEIEGICYSIQECKLTPERAVRAIERALNQRQAVKAEPCPLCHGITVEERVQEENTAFEAGRKFERELSAAQGVPEEYYADENEIIVFYQAMNDAGREENWPCNMRHRINMGLSAIHKRRSAAPEQAEIKEGKL
jgi:hypothetical protein